MLQNFAILKYCSIFEKYTILGCLHFWDCLHYGGIFLQVILIFEVKSVSLSLISIIQLQSIAILKKFTDRQRWDYRVVPELYVQQKAILSVFELHTKKKNYFKKTSPKDSPMLPSKYEKWSTSPHWVLRHLSVYVYPHALPSGPLPKYVFMLGKSYFSFQCLVLMIHFNIDH